MCVHLEYIFYVWYVGISGGVNREEELHKLSCTMI